MVSPTTVDLRIVLDTLSDLDAVGCSGQPERIESRYFLAQDIFHLANKPVRGASVLDCGCGRGTMSCVVAAMGAKDVTGIDPSKDNLMSFQEFQGRLPSELSGLLSITRGDATALPFSDARFDVVLMIEVVSHLVHVDNTFAEASRVLKTGGALLISDGNNARNPRCRREALRRWAEKEELRPRARYQSYRLLRQEWLMSRHPELPEEVATLIAEGTPQKVYHEVEQAYQAYLNRGTVPSGRYVPRWDNPAVNPGGWADDALMDPATLTESLRRAQFSQIRTVPYWGRSTGARRAIDNLLRMIPPVLSLPFARGFRIVAIK